MYAGRIVEQAGIVDLFDHPLHPYTRGLMASIPKPGQTGRVRLKTIPGSVPRLENLPPGCTFAPRCDIKTARCETDPDLIEIAPGHLVRCWKAR
jgi:peptide/nickel transport system ATP-binding protein